MASDRTVKVKLIADAKQYLDGLEKVKRETNAASGSIEQRLARQQEYFDKLGKTAMIAGAAMATGLALTVKAAMDWETAWAGVLKTVDGSPQQLSQLEQGLRGLTEVLPASHAEIAAVAEAAGQLGIATPNIVEFTETMINLGETTNMTAEEAATSLARFVNVMGTSQSEVSNLGSALVELGNNYATTEGEILEMSQRLSGAGVQIGMTEGDVLGLATALSSVGIEAEAGGSAMSKVMIDIASSVDKGGERLEMFSEVAGVSAQEFAAHWREDPGAALALFVQGLASAEEQGRSTFGILEQLGITEVRMRDALLRSASAAEQFSAAMETGNAAFGENTALAEEASKRYETLESKFGILRNQVTDAAIVIGERLMPAVEGVVGLLTDFASGIAGLNDVGGGLVAWGGLATAAIVLLGGTALLAIPKIAAFKAAVDDLGLSKSRLYTGATGLARFLVGPWGLALGAAVIGVGALNAALGTLRATADEFSNAIATGGPGSLSALLTEGFTGDGPTEDLEQLSAMLRIATDDFQKFLNGAFGNMSNFNQFTENLKSLDQALSQLPLEEATARFGEWGESVEATPEQVEAMLDSMPQLKGQLLDVASALDVDIQSLSDFDRQLWLAEAASGRFRDSNFELVDSTELAALGVEGFTTELEQQEQAAAEAAAQLDALADAVRALDDSYLTSQEALGAYYESIRAATEDLKELGTVSLDAAGNIDVSTEAGYNAFQSLSGVSSSALDAAASMIELDGDIEGANATVAAARDEFLLLLEQLGITGAEAEALADRYGLTEDAVESLADEINNIPDGEANITVNTDEAEDVLWTFINQKRVAIVDVEIGSKPDFAQAPGGRGTYTGYAAGGRLPGYAPGYDDRLGFLRDGSVVGLGGGEYIMPTRMTDKYLHILEQMRAGTFPGYANGGRLGAPSYSSSSSSVFNITVDQTINTASGVDAEGVARIGANRAVAAVAEYLGGR